MSEYIDQVRGESPLYAPEAPSDTETERETTDPPLGDHTWIGDPQDGAVTTVLVIGSFDWANAGMVHLALQEQLGGQMGNVRAFYSGCPRGAEAAAVEWFHANGITPRPIRDEEIAQLSDAVVVAFIRNHSAGAEQSLALAERAGLWRRVFRDETDRVISPWAGR